MLEAAKKTACIFACLLPASFLRAQEEQLEPQETVVVSATRLESQAAGFSERIKVEEIQPARSAAESLSESVGVQVRRLGGLGSYGSASIRGSTPEQVPVFLDGVLLNAGGFETVDLGKLPLELLSEIEIVRGPAAAFSGGGPGGAIFLRTHRPSGRRTELSASAGSFSTWEISGLHSRPIEASRLLVLASAGGSRGDFYYLNRNGTLFEPGDDRIERRANNRHIQAAGLASLETTLFERWRFFAAAEGFGKSQGVAGIESLPTKDTHLWSGRESLRLEAGRAWDGLALKIDAGQLLLYEEFRDTASAHGELGLGRQHNRALAHAVSAGARADYEAGRESFTSARMEGRFERFSAEDLLSGAAAAPKDRGGLQIALEERWRPKEWLELVPAARLGWTRSSFGGGPLPGGFGQMQPLERDDFLWQASQGASLKVGGEFVVKANLARSERQPSLGELFGDRGAVVGNPELRPERAFLADAGVVWETKEKGPLERLRLEAAWFGGWSADLIVWVQNSQSTVRPENVQAARTLGAELSLRLYAWQAQLEANYTYLHAVNLSDIPYLKGRRLPGRPAHELFARLGYCAERERWGLKIWADLDFAGRNYLDQANLKEDALSRLLFGVGLSLRIKPADLAVAVEVRNLLDSYILEDEQGRKHPLRDFESFPLPGRTVLVTLAYKPL